MKSLAFPSTCRQGLKVGHQSAFAAPPTGESGTVSRSRPVNGTALALLTRLKAVQRSEWNKRSATRKEYLPGK